MLIEPLPLRPGSAFAPHSIGTASRADGGELLLVAKADEKLERCRYLHRRIENFTRLRRAGGSGAQMERWRRSRQRYEEEYRRKRCFRFGRKLAGLR